VLILQTFESFKQGIIDLYTAPRLSEPVWLNMMSYTSYRYVLCDKFLKDFVSLLNMMSYTSYRYVLCDKFLKDFVSLVNKLDNKNNKL